MGVNTNETFNIDLVVAFVSNLLTELPFLGLLWPLARFPPLSRFRSTLPALSG